MGIWRGRTTFLGPDQHRWTVARSPSVGATEREDIYPRELMAHQARQWCSDIRVLILLCDVVRELQDEQGLRPSDEEAEHLLVRAFESGRLVALRGPYDPPPQRPGPPPRPFPNMPVEPARPVRDRHFLDVTIEDEEGKPLAGRVYKLTLPDVSVERGTIDGSGRIYRANVAEGTAWLEILPANAPPVVAEDVTPPSEPAPSPTTFSLRLVDELGQPVAGVDFAFAHGGATDTVTTDADGRATLNDPAGAPAATATFADGSALREAVRDRWNGPRAGDALVDSAEVAVIELHADLPPVVLAPTVEQTLSVQPYVERARLLGGLFAPNKSFLQPAGLDGVRGVVAMYGRNAGSALLAVGHTDATGSPDYNDGVSVERARSLVAFLAQDAAAWLAWYGDDRPAEKRWGRAEDLAMIGAMPDADQRSADEDPVRWYQRTRGLDVDGVAGHDTRSRLVPEYMGLEGTSLPDGIAATAHGCGQNFPADSVPDGTADPDNRRVEVFFFDGALGVQPPPPGDSSAPGSAEYPEWIKRAKKTADYEARETTKAYAVRVVDENDRPLEGVEVSITTPAGTSPVRTDANGLAQVSDAPAGAGSAQLSALDTLRGLFRDHARQARRSTSFPASDAVTLRTLKGAADPVALVGGITQTLMIVTRVDLYQDGQYGWQSLSLQDDGPYYLVPDAVGRLQMHSDAAGRNATVLGRAHDAAAPSSGSDTPIWAQSDVDALHDTVFAGDVETMLAFLRDLPIDPDDSDSRAPEGGGPSAETGDDGSDPSRELA